MASHTTGMDKALNLSTVCDILGIIQHKWFKIGVRLGIPRYVLVRFEESHDPLSAVVDYWLGGNIITEPGSPISWETLVTVLMSPHVTEPGLAKKISKEYCKPIQEEKAIQTSDETESGEIKSILLTDKAGFGEMNSMPLRASGVQVVQDSALLHDSVTVLAGVGKWQKKLPFPADNNSFSLKSILEVGVHQSTELYLDFSQVQKQNPAVQSLFDKLELSNYYPKKLQLKDALCIRPRPLKLSLGKIQPTDPKELPFLVLHKLMSYDVLCRSDLMPPTVSSTGSEYDDEYDDEYDYAKSDDGIHPVDILLALILCSDDFLCQDLLHRLAKCQLSVPFILPDPFTKQLTIPLWALRSIVKDWKSKINEGMESRTLPLISYPMPVISFIGFGKQKHGKSKSIILNEIISESHSHFFHRDCPGGQYNSLLGQGLVDMCWYLPAGKPSDTFHDAVTFLNLHGDARKYPQQTKFLGQISSMCFVLLTEEVGPSDVETVDTLKSFSACPGGIILLDNVGKNPKKIKEEIPRVCSINLTKKNAHEIKCSIYEQIKVKLSVLEQLKSIEECCKSLEEDNPCYTKGITLAMKLKHTITNQDVSTKEFILPLQSKKLWQAWAAEDKKLYRQIHGGNKSAIAYTTEIQRKKAALRKEQLKHVDSLNPAMEAFIKSLLQLEGPSNRLLRSYFLQCLKVELNNISQPNISKKKLQYQDVKRELTKLSSADQVLIEKHKNEMKRLQDEIIDASIDLEHFFRELGQVYEAAETSLRYKNADLSRLPKIAAELLIDGYPLEMMDRDAAHVPQLWVTAVFNEAVKLLNDPKVFVISAIGLKNSGKSTMVNTAFGLSFNVSAGRCTHGAGAYIQMLPLNEELKQATNCSYALVVNTEGLSAPELDPLKTQRHDYELATFVIGLANMTLININGEVAGDMDDILKTSVHAFLRTRQVKIHRSCQFVHQNVGSNVKSEVGRSKFTEKLNKFTVDAAREENCEGQYETFNSVIMFNDQKDVHHFPGLWKGDPPMAPVDQGYSHSAQMLKLSCIEILKERLSKGSSVGDLRLSSLNGKIGDLWKTLLKENFVFSFKNTLEITAYISLEAEYSKWEWTFHEGMLDWERKAENDISTADPNKVPEVVDRKYEDLKKYVSTQLYQPLKQKMDDFFRGQQAEILVQWEEKFNIRLINLSTELQQHAEKHCKKICESREAISKIESEKTKYANIIREKVQKYIVSLKKAQEKLDQNLESGKLESSQLHDILAKQLFNSLKMQIYEQKQLLTPDQAYQIKAIIIRSGGQLTEADLKNILVGQILGKDQVKKILKMGKQTSEEQLKREFNLIWNDLVRQLPSVTGEHVNVVKEVEGKLTDFVRTSPGQLIYLLQQKSLRHVPTLQFQPIENYHYKRVRTGFFATIGYSITRIVGGVVVESLPHHIEVLEITGRIFDAAKKYLDKIEKIDTDFNTAFIQELLRILDKKITEESAAVKYRLTFLREYRLDVYLTACGYAVPKFERLRDSFKERHDPRRYLETDIKGPLYTQFKSQYYQAEAEEAIARTLCAHLEEPIKTQIKNIISSKMVTLMKSSDQYYSSKMALKVKILTDIYKSDNFNDYMLYVLDIKKCLESWIKHYTTEFCDEMTGDQSTRLQVATRDELTRLIGVVENKVNELDESSFKQWIEDFAKNKDLRSELGINLEADNLLAGYEKLEQMNLKNLKEHIKTGLNDLKEKLHLSYKNIYYETEMKNWKIKPHEHLESTLIGCAEQCPFCGEQCDLLDPKHVDNNIDHTVSVHRSTRLTRSHDHETKVLTLAFCPAKVSGQEKYTHFKNSKTKEEWHPYTKYKEIYPTWSIPPDVTSEDSLYWKKFVGTYMDDIATTFKGHPGAVPDSWFETEWKEVRESLKKL